ncbi:MAG: OmpH family outer membrane protein, partial [bacterium]|nr:OmpH family outer membrane protein [bacterium]
LFVLIFILLTLTLFGFSEVKIGVVDFQQVIQKTKTGDQTLKKLETMKTAKEQEIQKVQNDLKKLDKELRSPALNTQSRERKTRDLEDKRIRYNRMLQDAQKAMQAQSQKDFLYLQKQIVPLIQQMGKTKGFKLILESGSSGTIYFDNTIDITAEVITAVDAKFPGK